MNFLQLLDGAEVLAQTGNPEIKGVEYDSRRVKPGDLFVAMRGESSDGNKYIDQAIAAGAVGGVSGFPSAGPENNVRGRGFDGGGGPCPGHGRVSQRPPPKTPHTSGA